MVDTSGERKATKHTDNLEVQQLCYYVFVVVLELTYHIDAAAKVYIC